MLLAAANTATGSMSSGVAVLLPLARVFLVVVVVVVVVGTGVGCPDLLPNGMASPRACLPACLLHCGFWWLSRKSTDSNGVQHSTKGHSSFLSLLR